MSDLIRIENNKIIKSFNCNLELSCLLSRVIAALDDNLFLKIDVNIYPQGQDTIFEINGLNDLELHNFFFTLCRIAKDILFLEECLQLEYKKC